MGSVYFYHLTRSGLEDTVRVLLGKSLAAGWRVELRCPDADTADRLDAQLWLGPEDGFLPHGRAGGDHDARQPVLLTVAGDPPGNAPTALMAVAGAPVRADEVTTLERASILFDGHDAAAVQFARDQWRVLTQAGLSAQYWSQEAGRWEKKSET